MNTSTSKNVRYTCDGSAGGVNESRLRGTVYPDGRTVDNAYGTLQMSVSLSEPGGGSTTVTGTTSSAHGLQAGDRITISGASPAGYDGTYTIATVPTSTTFTYTDVAGLGTATGSNITFSRTGQTPITSITKSGTTATVTTAGNHDLVTGDKVQIEGASDPLYDGIFTITYGSATTFTYTMSGTPAANASLTDATVSLYTLDTAISRPSGLQDAAVGGVDSAGQLLEGYAYLGLSTIVQRNRPQTGVNLTYEASDSNATSNPTNDGGDIYTGLDRFGRIVDQNWVNDSTGVSTDRFQYGYDEAGNVLYKNNLPSPSNSELYHANSSASGDNNTGATAAYDPLNRLKNFRRGTLTVSASHYNGTTGLDTVLTLNTNSKSSQSWTLDVLGNQASVTTDGTAAGNTVNSRNQKTAVNGNAVTFDNNGNALTGVGGAGTLTYDAWGDEITSATCSTSRVYDADGRMIRSTAPDNFSGSPITKQHDLYYTNKWQEAQDTATWTASGCGCGCCCTSHSDEEQYVWGQGYVDDLVLRDRTPDGSSTTRLYVQQDANYNVTAITNTSGTVQERFIFTPYGQETTLNANWTLATYSFGQFSQDSTAWIYGFQGWRYDSGTGFYTVRNRDYDVIFGWVGSDPGGYIDGMNPYQVEGSNPVNGLDPSGLAVYFISRQFGSPTVAGVPSGAAFSYLRTKHGYLLFTDEKDDGKDDNGPMNKHVIATFSWHPYKWLGGDTSCGIDEVPGRVWKNDPIDMAPWNSGKWNYYLITTDPTQEAQLAKSIGIWISQTGVGFEEGPHVVDPNSTDKQTPNEIGQKSHREPDWSQDSIPSYALLGQNCYWWAVRALMSEGFAVPREIGNDNGRFGDAGAVLCKKQSPAYVNTVKTRPWFRLIWGY